MPSVATLREEIETMIEPKPIEAVAWFLEELPNCSLGLHVLGAVPDGTPAASVKLPPHLERKRQQGGINGKMHVTKIIRLAEELLRLHIIGPKEPGEIEIEKLGPIA